MAADLKVKTMATSVILSRAMKLINGVIIASLYTHMSAQLRIG